jgi:hypothetical protein
MGISFFIPASRQERIARWLRIPLEPAFVAWCTEFESIQSISRFGREQGEDRDWGEEGIPVKEHEISYNVENGETQSFDIEFPYPGM